MLELLVVVVILGLLAWVVWLRARTWVRWHLERFRTAWNRLTDWRVSQEQAENVLRHVRWCAAGLTVMAVVPAVVWAYRYPEARARALVARYERFLVYQEGAEKLWLRGEGQLLRVFAEVDARADLDPSSKVNLVESVEPIWQVVHARRLRSQAVKSRIQAAIASVPPRVWPWTEVRDPLTQVGAPFKASSVDLQAPILRRVTNDPASMDWFRFVSAVSRPGAPALPPPSEWEGL